MNTTTVRHLKDRLSKFIPQQQIFTESAFLDVYSNDASIYSVRPIAVIKILSAGDISSALVACTELGIPVTARGGATGLAGGAVGRGVILDFCDYDKQIDINPVGLTFQVAHHRRRGRIEIDLFQQVDNIPRLPSGKFMIAFSELALGPGASL